VFEGVDCNLVGKRGAKFVKISPTLKAFSRCEISVACRTLAGHEKV
jgi:hypothetical protein